MSNITAKIISDSVSPSGSRLTTFELEYPRIIHSEFMTHRMLNKNSASSRAIPIKSMHQHLRDVPQYPSQWGKNTSGMQSKESLGELEARSAKAVWDAARESAIAHSTILAQIGCHKQIANRVTEPYMQMKVVCTGTEWDNFFWLRNHPDADPTIHELAEKMLVAMGASTPQPLNAGEWHLPYVDTKRHSSGTLIYSVEGQELSLKDARIISVSCCAQVSYRKNDDSLEKAKDIFQKLIGSEPVHASPTEHQGTPINYADLGIVRNLPDTWPEGVSHMDRDKTLWSGNFRNWIQFRKLIPNNTKW